jgi:acetylxylan esterase
LQQVTGFTAGPTGATMYIYEPTTKKSPAPIIVAIHYCTGTGPAYFSGTQYATYVCATAFIFSFPMSHISQEFDSQAVWYN